MFKLQQDRQIIFRLLRMHVPVKYFFFVYDNLSLANPLLDSYFRRQSAIYDQ